MVVNGHPDPRPERFCAALCDAYEMGARSGGWDVRRLDVGALSHDPEKDSGDFEIAWRAMIWATQFMVVFPLWLGRVPPALKNLFEEYSRRTVSTMVAERPMHSVITMDMPAFAHRALLQRNISPPQLEANVALPGASQPQRDFIGSVNAISARQRADWLEAMRRYGVDGR